MRFPPLYECSVCGAAVDVVPQGEGVEPLKRFSCPHTTAIIYANRKVILRGKGDMGVFQRWSMRVRLNLRQLLCSLTGRSI